MDKFKHPPITWYQKKLFIIVNIEIRDIIKENIIFEENNLIIEIFTKDDIYKEKLELFNKINPLKCNYNKTDYQISIDMHKFNSISWDHLTINDKNYNIKVNWNNYQDSDEEDTISDDPFKDNDSDDIPDNN